MMKDYMITLEEEMRDAEQEVIDAKISLDQTRANLQQALKDIKADEEYYDQTKLKLIKIKEKIQNENTK